MDGVNSGGAELGHLVVLLFPVLLVLELSPAVGDKSTSIPHTDEVSSESLQLEKVCPLLVQSDPGLTEVDYVRLQDGGVNPYIFHVGLKSGNVEGGHPDLAPGIPVPISRVLVQGPVRDIFNISQCDIL